jgi:hypothetical protein
MERRGTGVHVSGHGLLLAKQMPPTNRSARIAGRCSMTLPTRTYALAALVLSLAAACDRQPAAPVDPAGTAVLSGLPMNPPGREDAGFLSFTYSGDENGRYFAFGEPTGLSGSTPIGTDFAAATHYYLGTEPRQEFGTSVTSTARAQAGLSDGIHIQFPGALQTGTYPIRTCGRGGGPFCPLITLVFDVDNSVDGGGTQTRYFEFTSGSITIESVDDGRVKGTFQGVATQYYPTEGG